MHDIVTHSIPQGSGSSLLYDRDNRSHRNQEPGTTK